MNFEDFREDMESKIGSTTNFELREFRYEPYNFGSGMLIYRIKGRYHKFIYDGRENALTWLVSEPHQKYNGAHFTEYKIYDGLNITSTDIKIGLKNLNSI